MLSFAFLRNQPRLKMKKLLVVFAMALAVLAHAQQPKQETCSGSACCAANPCDSINIPVFLVDGVEVQNIDEIAPDDILKVDIIKDPAVTKIFAPRLGGVVVITTKSKKILKPIIEEYRKLTDEQKQNRIPGQLLIR